MGTPTRDPNLENCPTRKAPAPSVLVAASQKLAGVVLADEVDLKPGIRIEVAAVLGTTL